MLLLECCFFSPGFFALASYLYHVHALDLLYHFIYYFIFIILFIYYYISYFIYLYCSIFSLSMLAHSEIPDFH